MAVHHYGLKNNYTLEEWIIIYNIIYQNAFSFECVIWIAVYLFIYISKFLTGD